MNKATKIIEHKKEQESFKYQYTRPCLDWYEYVDVEIKPEDYTYFRLEARFGPSWWLIGMKSVEEPNYHREETQIGEIGLANIRRFIKWATLYDHDPFNDEYAARGNRIIEIKVISGDMDIFKKIHEIMPRTTQDAT